MSITTFLSVCTDMWENIHKVVFIIRQRGFMSDQGMISFIEVNTEQLGFHLHFLVSAQNFAISFMSFFFFFLLNSPNFHMLFKWKTAQKSTFC